MKRKSPKTPPQIVLREGKPAAVILEIKDYREMLERLEDVEDLKMLECMRRKPLQFRKLEDAPRRAHCRAAAMDADATDATSGLHSPPHDGRDGTRPS
jgi:PHD/YefM family antitoxin component YafN of YafNO toxin-antitoxin module